jgi:hypothetical protein
MLVDTGAEHSAVDESKVAGWSLYPSTFSLSQTLNGLSKVRIFESAITIFEPYGQFSWEVDGLLVSARPGSPFSGLPYEGLIGRDLLDRGFFVYGGASHRCAIAYKLTHPPSTVSSSDH